MRKQDGGPPKLDIIKPVPRGRIETVYVNPILDHLPNPNREAALEEKVRGRLIMTPTKRANSPIWPPPLCKPVRRPNVVLDDEPGEELAFGRSPSLPNDGIHAGANCPHEQRFIS
jgi:hypothetical protein